jgi:divalent metal cation (Fe/Co/Zn/Cd) transporter
MIKEPLGLFKRSLQELLGKSLGRKLEEEIMVLLKLAVNLEKYNFIDLKVFKVGRHYHALTLLKPLEAVTAAEMDAVRAKIQKNLARIDAVKSEVIFTEKKWY